MKNTVVKGYGKRGGRRFFRKEETKKMIINNQANLETKEGFLEKFFASFLDGFFFVLGRLGIR